MSFLDDLIAQQNGGGLLNGMYPSPLQGGGAAQPPAQGGGVFETGAAPFGFAGLAPAMIDPSMAGRMARSAPPAVAMAQPPADVDMFGARSWAPLSLAGPALQASSAPAGNDGASASPQLSEADLARTVRGAERTANPLLDPIDIAKSAGIGVVNGAIGLVGGLPNGLEYVGRHVIDPALHKILGPPPKLTGEPPVRRFSEVAGSANIQKGIEGQTGEFYQPRTGVGRTVETISEMAPLILGQGAVGIARGVAGGAAEAGAALRDLGSTLVKHAVLPGMAVQALENIYPDSSAGQRLQKLWPLARRVLPPVLAVVRAFEGPGAR
jgi:hypothetical protein